MKLVSRYRLCFMKNGKRRRYIGTNGTEKFGITIVILFILLLALTHSLLMLKSFYLLRFHCEGFLNKTFISPKKIWRKRYTFSIVVRPARTHNQSILSHCFTQNETCDAVKRCPNFVAKCTQTLPHFRFLACNSEITCLSQNQTCTNHIYQSLELVYNWDELIRKNKFWCYFAIGICF